MTEPKNDQKKGVIRNATLEDIEALKKKESVPAMTEAELKETQKTPEESQEPSLKPKTTRFEPDSVPVKLPSGKFAVQKYLTPNNEIMVRRMTAVEENMFYQLLGGADMKAINATIDLIMENCIKTNISTFELSLIDKLPVFFKILQLTYGNMVLDIECEKCKQKFPVPIDLVSDCKVLYVPDNYEYPKRITLETYPNSVIDWYVTYPTIKQSGKFFDADIIDVRRMLTHHIEGFITEDGKEKPITKEDYEAIVTNINQNDKNKYHDFLNEFGSFGTDLSISKSICDDKDCEMYGRKQNMTLPVEDVFVKIIQLQNRQ